MVKPHMKHCLDKFPFIPTLEFLALSVILKILPHHDINLGVIPSKVFLLVILWDKKVGKYLIFNLKNCLFQVM